MRFPEFTHPDDVDEDVRLCTLLASGEIDQYKLDKRSPSGTGPSSGAIFSSGTSGTRWGG